MKWAGVDLNHRHTDFQSVALPTELPARKTQNQSISGLKFNPKKNDIASNLKRIRRVCRVLSHRESQQHTRRT